MADSNESGTGTLLAAVGVTALLVGGIYAYSSYNTSKSKRVKSSTDPKIGEPAPGWYVMAYRAPGGDISKGRLKEGSGPLRSKKEAEDAAREYRKAGYVPGKNGAVEVKYSDVYI